jgi:hypothetical protein
MMPDLNDIHVLLVWVLNGQAAAPMFVLFCHLTSECCPEAGSRDFRVLPGSRSEKWSVFSAKKNRNVGISMLQGQQIKPVGTQRFNTDYNLFNSKHDGKVYYESEIFMENLSSILKIFTFEPSHWKFWIKSVGPESGSKIF